MNQAPTKEARPDPQISTFCMSVSESKKQDLTPPRELGPGPILFFYEG